PPRRRGPSSAGLLRGLVLGVERLTGSCLLGVERLPGGGLLVVECLVRRVLLSVERLQIGGRRVGVQLVEAQAGGLLLGAERLLGGLALGEERLARSDLLVVEAVRGLRRSLHADRVLRRFRGLRSVCCDGGHRERKGEQRATEQEREFAKHAYLL